MVELNVRANQGITQAIATKLNLTSTDLKKLDASIWSGVMKDVQSSKSTNFTSKTNDVNSINDKNKNHSNFVIDKGAVKIDDGVWSKITTMIKNALNKSKPAATTAATTATTAATSTD